jgi:hypothetical protein
MINTATILRAGETAQKPINNDHCLEAAYKFGTKMHILTTEGEYLVEKPFDNKSDESATNKRNSSPLFLWYGAHYKSTLYSWEEDTTDMDGEDLAEAKKIKKNVYEFWKNHPKVMWNGKKDKGKGTNPCTDPVFNIVIESDKTMEQELNFNKQTNAIMELNDMDYQQLCDVLYYFGHTPQNRNTLQIKMFLGDLRTGILFADPIGREETNIDKFLNFCNKENTKDIDYHVTIAKAIDQGIITEEKSGTGKNYKLDGVTIASNNAQLIGYMRENPQIYNTHIKGNIKDNVSPGKYIAAEIKTTTPNSIIAKDLITRGYLHHTTSFKDEAILETKVKEAQLLETEVKKMFPDAIDLNVLANKILPQDVKWQMKSKSKIVEMIFAENTKK